MRIKEPIKVKELVRTIVKSVTMIILWSGLTWAISNITGLKFSDIAPVLIMFIIAVIWSAHDNNRYW